MLLDDVVARQPGEVEPVAHLPLEVAPARLARLVPERALVPVGARGDDLADAAVLDALHRLDVAQLVPALGAGADAQALGLRRLGGGEHRADARPVDGDRLLGEDVLAGGDRGLEVRRPEAGRRREDHVVHARRGDHLLVRVEPDEGALVGHRARLAQLLEPLARLADAVGEGVADRHHADAGRALDGVGRRAAPAAAAADEADADLVAARRVNGRRAQAGGQERPSGHGTRADEVAPRAVLVVHAAPFQFASKDRTTRKPTNVASVCHQMLCGSCGSRSFQDGSDTRRAAQPAALASSIQEPPFATCG